jgi:predicted metal-binding membrane protein
MTGVETVAARGETSAGTGAVLMLATAATAAVVSLRQMNGMDLGVATDLGSLGFFAGAWTAMMAAMMLPGAIPAAFRFGYASRRPEAVPLFAASYLAVWVLVGLAAYAVYEPHGTTVAGALTAAAGLYELTPLKGACRRRCRARVRSGLQFGVNCAGSSIGLMTVLLALGAMSVTWSGIVAALVLAQKLLPPRAVVDVPVALALVALGAVVAAAPAAVSGLT